MSPMIVLAGSLNGPGHFLHVGPVQIAVANLVVILIMIAVFVLAILVPFPEDER